MSKDPETAQAELKDKKERTRDASTGDVVKRLDALIRLSVETSKSDKRQKGLSMASAAKILKSIGLTPTEIARIFGKKSRTDVAGYLYSKEEKEEEE